MLTVFPSRHFLPLFDLHYTTLTMLSQHTEADINVILGSIVGKCFRVPTLDEKSPSEGHPEGIGSPA